MILFFRTSFVQAKAFLHVYYTLSDRSTGNSNVIVFFKVQLFVLGYNQEGWGTDHAAIMPASLIVNK